MLAHARPVAVTTNRHVLLYRSVGAPVREKCKLVDRHRVQCSPSNGEWHAAADGDWGSNVTGTDEEDKRTPTVRAAVLVASGLAVAFILTRLSWTANTRESIAQGQTGQSQPAQSITTRNADSDAQGSPTPESADMPGQDGTQQPTASAASAVVADSDAESSGGAGVTSDEAPRRENRESPSEAPESEPGLVAEDGTQEPLLQHLFEDLKHRPTEKQSPIPNENIHFEETSIMGLSSHGDDARAQEKASDQAAASKEGPALEEERVDELAVKHSDIAELGGLTGHEQLQQRAALAVRAAHAALRACESASAHSAASCRAASEAASAANNATHAASQALTAADRGAAEDLERAMRRVQLAQQQARDAEAAAATAATSAGVKAATAAEQEQLAQEAASPQRVEHIEHRSLGDKAKAVALQCKATVAAWWHAVCTWCAHAWQAFLAWTSRMGEHVQQFISRWQ